MKPILVRYLEYFHKESGNFRAFSKLLEKDPKPVDRFNYHDGLGHATGSGLILSPDKKCMLLIFHKKLNRWLQPGGHVDSDDLSPLHAAIRESLEETKAEIGWYLSLVPEDPYVPLDLDTHIFPQHPATNQPEHFHHDFRYVFLTRSNKIGLDTDEVIDYKWVKLEEMAKVEKHITGMANKIVKYSNKLQPIAIEDISTLQ